MMYRSRVIVRSLPCFSLRDATARQARRGSRPFVLASGRWSSSPEREVSTPFKDGSESSLDLQQKPKVVRPCFLSVPSPRIRRSLGGAERCGRPRPSHAVLLVAARRVLGQVPPASQTRPSACENIALCLQRGAGPGLEPMSHLRNPRAPERPITPAAAGRARLRHAPLARGDTNLTPARATSALQRPPIPPSHD